MKQADREIITLLGEIRDAGAAAETDPLALHSVLVGKTVFVDSVNGNDATGVRGDASKPFLTLTAAKTAATSGDTIFVGPGTYAERNLLKNGVNWYFYPGATVDITTTSPAQTGANDTMAAAIFDDSVRGANGAVVCSINGFGVFSRNELTLSGQEATVFIRNPASNVSINCKSIIGAGEIYWTIWGDGGRCTINCETIIGAVNGVFWSNGDLFINAVEITSNFTGPTILTNTLYGGGGNRWLTGGLWIKAQRLTNTNTGSVINTIGNASARVWIEAQKIEGTGGPVVTISGNKVYIKAEKIECTGDGQVVEIAATGAGLWLEAQKVEGGGDGIPLYLIDSNSANIKIQSLVAGVGAPAAIEIDGGSAVVEVQELTTASASTKGLYHTAGNLRLLNTKIDASLSSSSNPIVIADAGLVLQNCVLIAEAGRDSITASGAQDVKVYGTSVTNKAKHVNITVLIGTLTVNADVT